MPPPVPPGAPKIGHKRSEMHSADSGLLEHISGDADDAWVLEESARKRSFRKEVILVVADELTLDAAVNLVLNLADHGLHHYLLVTAGEGLCQRLHKLAAQGAMARTDGMGGVDLTPLEALTCLYTTAYSQGEEQAIHAGLMAGAGSGAGVEGMVAHARARIALLRARYLLRLVDLGYNVLALDPATHFQQDPYDHLKQEQHRETRLFVGSAACSLHAADQCCPGEAFPCLNPGLVYAQHVVQGGEARRVLSEWAYGMETVFEDRGPQASAKQQARQQHPGAQGLREAKRALAAPKMSLDSAVADALQRAGAPPGMLHSPDGRFQDEPQAVADGYLDSQERRAEAQRMARAVAAWRKGGVAIDLGAATVRAQREAPVIPADQYPDGYNAELEEGGVEGVDLAPMAAADEGLVRAGGRLGGPERLAIVSPAEWSPLRRGNTEWPERDADARVGGLGALVAAQFTQDHMPSERRFMLQAHAWWHQQAELAVLDGAVRYGKQSRLLALDKHDQVTHLPAQAWKTEVERLITFAAAMQRIAVLPLIDCEGAEARGWKDAEMVKVSYHPGSYTCHFNLGALHGDGHAARQLICDHTKLLSSSVHFEHDFQAWGLGWHKTGPVTKNAAIVDLGAALDEAEDAVFMQRELQRQEQEQRAAEEEEAMKAEKEELQAAEAAEQREHRRVTQRLAAGKVGRKPHKLVGGAEKLAARSGQVPAGGGPPSAAAAFLAGAGAEEGPPLGAAGRRLLVDSTYKYVKKRTSSAKKAQGGKVKEVKSKGGRARVAGAGMGEKMESMRRERQRKAAQSKERFVSEEAVAMLLHKKAKIFDHKGTVYLKKQGALPILEKLTVATSNRLHKVYERCPL